MGWYSVSVETLRGLGLFLAVLVLVTAAFFGYRYWESWALERQAAGLIAESDNLIETLRSYRELPRFSEQYGTGRKLLIDARASYAAGDLREAVDDAKRSRNVMAAILSTLEVEGQGGEGAFISVDGGVEFRRSNSEWTAARSRVTLNAGDRVRTSSNGSAEIMFTDGTVYTVNPNSSIVVTPRAGGGDGDSQAVGLEYGLLDLATRDNPTRVGTPEVEARVEQQTQAFVSYDQESRRGRIGAVRGQVVVEGEGGTRRLGDLEQVEQRQGALSHVSRLPAPPDLVAPRDKREFDAGRQSEIVLEWSPVAGAGGGYALQVSRTRLFVNNLIDVTGRRKTSARLGIRGDGSFQWRVAAVSPEGERGPWSTPRNFRVSTVADAGGTDTEPPPLEIEKAVGYGNIFIVEGKTEAGSSVEINGETAKVEADGTFIKTIQLSGEGYGIIEVRARDAWGNVSDHRERVYIESL